MLKISIIVPTANRRESLIRTVDSLVTQSFDPNHYEIIIVENGSDQTCDISTFDGLHSKTNVSLRYFHDPVPGLLTGRHRGALEAQADLLVFVDDDIVAAPGWLASIVRTFNDQSISLVGGRNLPTYEVDPPEWLEAFRSTTPYGGWALGELSLLDLGDHPLDIKATYVWGLNFAIRRQTLFDLGGFHPDCIPDTLQHFQGDGETGLSLKADSQSLRAFYQPDAVVHHCIPATRLTPAYFEKRYFFQGVCNSYTEIRGNGGLNHGWGINRASARRCRVAANTLLRWGRSPLFHFKNFSQRHVRKIGQNHLQSAEALAIKQKAQKALHAGYDFHQSAVAQNPELLAWVLRDNYWDYRLPAIEMQCDC